MPSSKAQFDSSALDPASVGAGVGVGVAETGARQECLERMEELRSAMLRALEILHAVRALFELNPRVGRAEFAGFVGGAVKRLPELQALEWIPRVSRAERSALEQAALADGVAEFGLRVIDARGRLVPAPEADEYWPVNFVEPIAANLPVLGLDMRADPYRREVLERAAATGLPVATSPLRLAQQGQRRLGFLVVMAVGHHPAWEKKSPAQDATAGWVLAVFRVQRLVEKTFAPLVARGLRIEIRDLQDEATPAFVVGDALGETPAWHYVQDMPVAGRVWRFTFAPGPRFRVADPAWLARAAADLQFTNAILEQRVAERTAELEARTAALEKANHELRAEAARREAAEAALARADEQLSVLSAAEARQWGLAGLVGRSERFGRLLREVRAVQAAGRTTVLLTGESGTGKELIARAIHYGGAPAAAPFIRVDCVGLSAPEAEAALFGQLRMPGQPERRGSCDLADGGTLFFDEIGDLPAPLQARLLRVLEDGAFRPAGAEQSRTLNARVIAATHADLPAKVAAGTFRQDLYYRLLHYHIAVPALRERMDDVPALAQYFVRQISSELKRHAPRLRPEALQRLLSHAYPGNIRELKNTLERAIIYAGSDELGAEHIVFAPPAGQASRSAGEEHGSGAAGLNQKFLADLPLNLAAAERLLVARAIAVSEGNLSRAARLLGVNRTSLYRWQEKSVAEPAVSPSYD
ncbi:MAG: sigma 54-interacting transcriptional regulator [Verrucomicrobia bacterium]|nr:sigma 54-interacting transcriptional regulator [Verrucomicrobiota bacterium]